MFIYIANMVYSVFVINYGVSGEKKNERMKKQCRHRKIFRWNEVRVGELRAKHVYDARGALLTPQSSRSTRTVNTERMTLLHHDKVSF